MAAAFYYHSLALIVEYPYFIVEIIGIGFSEYAGLVEAAEFFPAFRCIKQISGTVIIELVFYGFFFEVLPVIIGNIHYFFGIYHI